MHTVNAQQPSFRHEFYAVALRHEGTNTEVMGKPLRASLFFNSPYQVVTWDIAPDWKGWYIIFGKEFISMNPAWSRFILDFPFFRLDKTLAFDLPPDERLRADACFKRIFEEYHSESPDKFSFIQAYTQLLLVITKRFFDKCSPESTTPEHTRTADTVLVSRFQSLIESHSATEDAFGDHAEVRQASFYADLLNVHPNHLNAVVKRITGNTASYHIQEHLLLLAKSLLTQTELSTKEIAFRLHFSEPTHFTAFFKKQTGQTPQQFRDNRA